MTTVKIDAKLAANASFALEPLISHLYSSPGVRIVGVVELAHIERTQPAPDEDKEASVKLGIKHLEIARDDQEHHLREAMRALYLNRTAQGTLDDAGDIELSERTLQLTAGVLHAVESARLRVALRHWADYARQAATSDLSVTQLQKEFQTLAGGLAASLTATIGGGDG